MPLVTTLNKMPGKIPPIKLIRKVAHISLNVAIRSLNIKSIPILHINISTYIDMCTICFQFKENEKERERERER